jgi:hypothetical protein
MFYLITLIKFERHLDNIKKQATILNLKKRGMNLDSYVLITVDNVLVTDFNSIKGLTMLIFRIPEKIVPLSGNEWTDTQLDQLGIVFEDVDRVDFFFRNANLESFEMSERGTKLVGLLKDIDNYVFFRDYEEVVRANSPFQHPICKALYAAKKYANHESFIDDFVTHLLNKMGFNEGSLYAAPQMRISLFFGDTERMATADFTIIDFASYARIGVIEDKNWSEMMSNSTPQLVAEVIAIAQCNEATVGQKRDADGEPKDETDLNVTPTASSETIYGIRVNGHLFHFYALQVTPSIRSAMRNQRVASDSTTMYRYKSDAGLNFLVKEERYEIILMLSLLQEVAKRTGETSPRRNSRLGMK